MYLGTAISGNFAIIGSPNLYENDAWGVVHFLEYDEFNQTWNNITKLNNYGYKFGTRVDISGYCAIITTVYFDVYIFEYDKFNQTWNNVTKFVTTDYIASVDIYCNANEKKAIVGVKNGNSHVYSYNLQSKSWYEYISFELSTSHSTLVAISSNFAFIGASNTSDSYIYYMNNNNNNTSNDDVNTVQILIFSDYTEEYDLQFELINTDTGNLEASISACDDIILTDNAIFEGFIGGFYVKLTNCNPISRDSANHGIYKIIINDSIIVGYGGYYYESEINTICTDNTNHMSYCVEPQSEYCQNNNNLWAFSDDDTSSVPSYKGIVGSTVDYYNDITCSGDNSCINTIFMCNDIICTGIYSCKDAYFDSCHTIYCFAVGSCDNVIVEGAVIIRSQYWYVMIYDINSTFCYINPT